MARKKVPAETDFDAVFARLRAILTPYAPGMVVMKDEPGYYYLDTTKTCANKKPSFFGAAKMHRSYVSYYLMPVYANPELLDGTSDELRKRMQGKSCFNFTAVDDLLFEELADLTKAGHDWYKDANLA
ncbi:MAG TPA: hypothetical protein VMZ71_02690 [Gemmataceae bacterium]|nr:hypothetical protein [Gemmataceae bacterium]